MSLDPFSILRLSQDRTDPGALRAQFAKRAEELKIAMKGGRDALQIRRDLEELDIAYKILQDPESRTVFVRREKSPAPPERAALLRALIVASLEDGLLRHSRRQRILEEGRKLGFSPFHTQLLIAQTQFGPQRVLSFEDDREHAGNRPGHATARFSAAVVLGFALFLAAVRWLGL